MKKLKMISLVAVTLLLMASCVSKKKYTELQDKYEDSQAALYKSNAKLDQINEKVDNYYARINNLKDKNEGLIDENRGLTDENSSKFELTDKGNIISKNTRAAMEATLSHVDPDQLAQAQTLSDSMDLAVAYNLRKMLGDDDDFNINVDRTVVEITVSDNLLFRSSSYKVNPKAYDLLDKISNLTKSEPAVEVLVEGHTDSKTFIKGSYIKDNWDLSLRRAAAVVRILQDKYGVDGAQLIASGRSSYKPIAGNDTAEGRQRNRRTRIIILPNLDKFLALLGEQPIEG